MMPKGSAWSDRDESARAERRPDLDLGATRSTTASVNSDVVACPPRSTVLTPVGGRLQDATRRSRATRARRPHSPARPRSTARTRRRAAWPSGSPGSCPTATARCRAAPRPSRPRPRSRRRSASRTDSAPAIEPNIGITRSERQSPSRFSAGITSGDVGGAGDQARVQGVDQDRLVRDVRVAGRRRVHLLLEHPLVDRGDRPLRAAVDLARRSARRS